MNEIKLHLLDFNLLRVFIALFEEQSVTRAAARMNITPSAVSHSLNRLRLFFEDELFVRRSSGMRPTMRAMEMGPRIRNAMKHFEQAILPSRFDPAENPRSFVMTLAPYICRLILPHVMDRFRVEAPRSQIRIRPRSRNLLEDFNLGHVDIAIVQTERMYDEFVAETLFTDQWVWAVPEDHPYSKGELTIERLAEISHVVASGRPEALLESGAPELASDGRRSMTDNGALDNALAAKGLTRNVTLNVPDSMTALAVASRSSQATMVPRLLVQEMASYYGLRLFDPPYPAPPIEVRMVWRRDHAEEPGLKWLRELVLDASHEAAKLLAQP